MKELKNYIHLYIGSKVQWVRSDGQIVIQELTLSDASWLSHRADVKLVLRPLESMTDGEAEEYAQLGDGDFNTGRKGHYAVDMMQADMVHWALKKGFDLFDLHAAGLAVYENEMK